jgi:hypothetical protein
MPQGNPARGTVPGSPWQTFSLRQSQPTADKPVAAVWLAPQVIEEFVPYPSRRRLPRRPSGPLHLLDKIACTIVAASGKPRLLRTGEVNDAGSF